MENLYLPFDKSHKESIKACLNWDEAKYALFCENWSLTFTTVYSLEENVLYNEKYFSNLLDLFFVRLSLDILSSLDKKSILLSLLVFYLFEMDKSSYLSENTLDKIDIFLQFLEEKNLISISSRVNCLALLHNFVEDCLTDLPLFESYTVLESLLLVTDPVKVNSYFVFLYEKPDQTVFFVKKPYPKQEEIFDSIFKRSLKIKDPFLKKLYATRLHSLMDVQYKKSIFPF